VEKLDITGASDVNKIDEWDIDVSINNAAIGDSGPLTGINPQRRQGRVRDGRFLCMTTEAKGPAKAHHKGRADHLRRINTRVIPTPFYASYAMTRFALESVAFSL